MAMADLTPQERWALKNKLKGKCTRCGRKRNQYKWLCDYCQAKNTLYMKRYRKAISEAKKVRQQILGTV